MPTRCVYIKFCIYFAISFDQNGVYETPVHSEQTECKDIAITCARSSRASYRHQGECGRRRAVGLGLWQFWCLGPMLTSREAAWRAAAGRGGPAAERRAASGARGRQPARDA